MLLLDDEDYELLGYGSESADNKLQAELATTVALRNARQREYDQARRPRNGRPPRNVKGRLACLKEWRKKNPEKWRATNRKYKRTEKGKAMKKKSNRAYYEKHREREIARNRAVRAAKKAKQP